MNQPQTGAFNLWIVTTYFALVIIGLSQPPLHAAPPASPSSELEKQQVSLSLQLHTAAQVIEDLSVKLGRSILVDGEPKAEKLYVEFHGSAKEALDKVSDQLDCTWTTGKQGVILMQKRFHNRDDLPQMHLKEMQKMAQDVLAIWPAAPSEVRSSYYPFDIMDISPANGLYRALTPEQRRELHSGLMLSFDTLSPEQKEIVRLGIYNGVVNNSRDVWQKLKDRLMGMSQEGYLQWRPINPLKPTPDRMSLDYIWLKSEPRRYYERLVTLWQLNYSRQEAQP